MNPPDGRRYTTQLGGRELSIATGKYAKQVSGSVMVRYGETVILVTAQMSPDKSPMDFMPLTVEYEERHYAIGKIPGSFQRREGRPSIQAKLLLTSPCRCLGLSVLSTPSGRVSWPPDPAYRASTG